MKYLTRLGVLIGFANALGWIAVRDGRFGDMSITSLILSVFTGSLFSYFAFFISLIIIKGSMSDENAECSLIKSAPLIAPAWLVVDLCGFLILFMISNNR